MNEKSYFYHDEESNDYKIGGEPVKQEKVIGEQMNEKLDRKPFDY